MDQAIKAGISGFVLAVIIYSLSPENPYFLPELAASIIVIYVFDLRTYKDALLAAFMTYLISEGILSSISVIYYFVTKEPVDLTIDIWLVLGQILIPVTAVLAAIVGVLLARTRRPTARAPPPPAPIPPV